MVAKSGKSLEEDRWKVNQKIRSNAVAEQDAVAVSRPVVGVVVAEKRSSI